MKSWTVQLCSGELEKVSAEIVTYDQAGNLVFANTKKIAVPSQQPGELELIRCINDRQYVQYYPSATVQ